MGCYPAADSTVVLAHIWLETDDDGWTICTVRDIRSSYASLPGQCEISYCGECFMSTLTDFLPTLSDIEFRAGKASKDPEKRRASAWRFNPCCLCVMSLPGVS